MPRPTVSIDLVLAGVGFRTRVLGTCPAEHVTARFGAFTGDPGERAVDLEVAVDPAWRPPHAPRAVFPAADATRLADGRVRFVRVSDQLTYDPEGRTARGWTTGTAPGLAAVVDPTALDTPLRLLMSYELPRRGGMLVHACGYADDRGAVLFIAPSGGGKTTTARKLPHASVLSDDQVALRRDGAVWTAWALPFVGEYARAIAPRSAPLRAVVLLAKAPVLDLHRVAPAQALARVLAGTVYFLRGDPSSAALLDLAGDLVDKVPVYTLALPREAPVAPVLDQLLR